VLDCAHLVEPLEVPGITLNHFQVTEVRWANGTLQLRMNTGEGYQFHNVPRRIAVEIARNPGLHELRGYAFNRVRGRMPIASRFLTLGS
jgi:hypothetical protein